MQKWKKLYRWPYIIITVLMICIIGGVAHHYISKALFIPHVEKYMHKQGLPMNKVRTTYIGPYDMGDWNYVAHVHQNGHDYEYDYSNMDGNDHISLMITYDNADISINQNPKEDNLHRLKYKPLKSDPLWK